MDSENHKYVSSDHVLWIQQYQDDNIGGYIIKKIIKYLFVPL